MENMPAIQAKINELNAISPGWTHLIGFSAITSFSYGQNGQTPTFNASSGLPVKVFLNNITGEVKIFSAHLFRI
jgi:hypothetical protein